MPNQTVKAASKYLDENYPTGMYDEQTIINAGKDFMQGYDEGLSDYDLLLQELKDYREALTAANEKILKFEGMTFSENEEIKRLNQENSELREALGRLIEDASVVEFMETARAVLRKYPKDGGKVADKAVKSTLHMSKLDRGPK